MHFCISTQVGQPNCKVTNTTLPLTHYNHGSPHRFVFVVKVVLGQSLTLQLYYHMQVHVRVIIYDISKSNRHVCATRATPCESASLSVGVKGVKPKTHTLNYLSL